MSKVVIITETTFTAIVFITIYITPTACQILYSSFSIVLKVKVAQLCLTFCDPMDYTVDGILQARILEWVASPFSKGIFPTQGLNPGLLHCRQILYQLSYHGSPRILEWVAYPFSSGSSQPRNQTGMSCIVGGFFFFLPAEPPRKPRHFIVGLSNEDPAQPTINK